MAMYERDPDQPVVVQREDVVYREPAPVVDSVVTVDRAVWYHWTAATIVALLCGAALIVIGVIAVVRGDLQGSINDPVVEVAGWSHTPLLGLIEIGAGVLLLLSSTSLGAQMVIGAAVAIFGIIALIEPTVVSDTMEIESSLAWVIILLGAAPFAAAAISTIPRTRRTTAVRRVERV
jgi:uncharacterized membrane protein HdeD (DUF308 family)